MTSLLLVNYTDRLLGADRLALLATSAFVGVYLPFVSVLSLYGGELAGLLAFAAPVTEVLHDKGNLLLHDVLCNAMVGTDIHTDTAAGALAVIKYRQVIPHSNRPEGTSPCAKAAGKAAHIAYLPYFPALCMISTQHLHRGTFGDHDDDTPGAGSDALPAGNTLVLIDYRQAVLHTDGAGRTYPGTIAQPQAGKPAGLITLG